ncbi:MAG: ParB/RepB/Spo0J family partition protein [Chloroflexota bacterium]|nr:ParB/RepB/Spo0J family partition protein [Ardenticatenaceae bacterium]
MSKKRGGLGRGLGALIPGPTDEGTVLEEGEAAGLRTVLVADIQPNPRQPRSIMDEEKLSELAASIKEHGLIQPLIVTATESGFILIAGERRWRASQLAGLVEVPVVVKEATPQAMLELALIENIQRADLNPLEEAYAYQQLIDDFGLTQQKVSQRVGKARSTVANLVRLLELPSNIQQAVTDGLISGTHARVLLQLPEAEQQTEAMGMVLELNLSVRQTELLVKILPFNLSGEVREAVLHGRISQTHAEALLPLPTHTMQNNLLHQITMRKLTVVETEALVRRLTAGKRPQQPKKKRTLPAEIIDLQKQFSERLGQPVEIQKSGKTGKVILHFYSDEELQAIYDAIIGAE